MTELNLTAIFDLDGTLVDSFNQILTCCQLIRKRLGMKHLDEKELKALIGLPAERLFSSNSPDITETAVIMFRNELTKEIETGNDIFDGTEELLKFLKSQSIKTAVATSKPHNLALKVVKNSKLDGLIDHVQGIEDFDPKPDPEVVLRCQRKLPADKFVMIGDRPEDIQAGLKSGCYTVGVAQGTFRERELKEFGAHEVFSSIECLSNEMLDFLTRLENYG